MERIAVVLGSNIHWAPFYMKYEKLLKQSNIPYDLIFWNREGLEETIDAPTICFDCRDQTNNSSPLKLFKFLKFAAFVRRTIQKNHYDKVIFLGGAGCAAVLNTRYLKHDYEGRYWLDIRDYQYEWFRPFLRLETKVVKASHTTAISSRGYEEFLPQHDYLYVHNLDADIQNLQQQFHHTESDGVVRISFIGNIRYFDQNKALIDMLANDERFCLQFFGSGSELLQKYCMENGIKNVRFVGRFFPEETIRFYEQTDIVNNIYGNDSIALTTALSNKLYYAVAFQLPILVCSNTHMETFSQKYGFSFTYSNDPAFKERLYNWYREFSNKDTTSFLYAAWTEIMSEDQAFEARFMEFVHGQN